MLLLMPLHTAYLPDTSKRKALFCCREELSHGRTIKTRPALRELGIRVALGAQRKEVLQAALGRALKLLAIGSAAGLLLGILASRVLAFIVYQATPRDPHALQRHPI